MGVVSTCARRPRSLRSVEQRPRNGDEGWHTQRVRKQHQQDPLQLIGVARSDRLGCLGPRGSAVTRRRPFCWSNPFQRRALPNHDTQHIRTGKGKVGRDAHTRGIPVVQVKVGDIPIRRLSQRHFWPDLRRATSDGKRDKASVTLAKSLAGVGRS